MVVVGALALVEIIHKGAPVRRRRIQIVLVVGGLLEVGDRLVVHPLGLGVFGGENGLGLGEHLLLLLDLLDLVNVLEEDVVLVHGVHIV